MAHVDYQNRVDYLRHLCGCWQCSTRDGTAQKCLPWRQTALYASGSGKVVCTGFKAEELKGDSLEAH
jgi:hypothetical protein